MKHLNVIRERAYAKINLFLDVKSIRHDGFHDLETVMHSLSLCDLITVATAPSDVTDIKLITDANLPTDSNNLAYLAAQKYLLRAGISASVKINLEKNIPIGAGLGGGSSDAAAILRALNSVYRKFSRSELLELSLSIGSDVPFCLVGGTQFCTGRGEPTQELKIERELYFVIAKGDGKVSAKDAYCALDAKHLNSHGFIDVSRNFSTCSTLAATANDKKIEIPIYNVFEHVISERDHSILSIGHLMAEHGAIAFAMSGSGPSVFGIFDASANADEAASALQSADYYAVTACSSRALYLD